ncbi:MAG: hypothetical protein IMY67_03915 [Bacteroidetes bacterium]|nr:hypothetical protein [Bacteroidota bacterium]
MILLLHAETYFYHYQLKLMPENHWSAYVKFIKASITAPGMKEIWAEVASAYSHDFLKWLDKQFLELDANKK